MHPLGLALGLFVALALTPSARADPLTFEQALARAEANAPTIAAARQRLDAANAVAVAAGTRPDPRLGLSVENVPVSGSLAGRFDADGMTMARIGVTQDFPSRERRDAERQQAQADTALARARLAVVSREVRLATALAWIDYYYAQRRQAALEGVLRSLSPLWDAAPQGLTSGSLRPAQALAPIRMRAELEDLRSELVAAAARARSALSRWTGDPAPTTVGGPPEASIDVEGLRSKLAQNPLLLPYSATTARAEADLSAARAATRPNLSFDFSYGRRSPMFGDMVSAGVTVDLPLFQNERQQPVIAARTSDLAGAQIDRADALRALVAAFEADLADHAMHHEQWMRWRDTVLPAAQQQSDLETASYGAGTATLSDVLEAFTNLARAKIDVLERESVVVRDSVRINILYGSDQS